MERIKYDLQYYLKLQGEHNGTEEIVNKARWEFVKDIPHDVVLDYGSGCNELTTYAPKDVIVDSYDIGRLNGDPYPQTGILHEEYDIIFLNDVIEHVDWKHEPDFKMLKTLERAQYLSISLPILPENKSLEGWKHHKPNEHLTIFTREEIIDFIEKRGFKKIREGFPECPPREDILSLIFRKLNNEEKTLLDRITKTASSRKRKILLIQDQSPGDILTMTRAVIDLKLMYPNWDIDIATTCPAIFENCPYITPLDLDDPEVEAVKIDYPEINNCGMDNLHYTDAFRNDIMRKIKSQIYKKGYRPEVWLSAEEREVNQIEEETGWDGPFWILNAGHKPENKLKQYHRWQEVVDLLNKFFNDKVKIIQIGSPEHVHPSLTGIINFIGKTDIRQLIRLGYWSDGIMGPLSFQSVLAASLKKPSVVIAGGREAVSWHIYPQGRYIFTNGTMECCNWNGCWICGDIKKCRNLSDGVPLCYKIIKPYMIVDAVKMYYEGGMLSKDKKLVEKWK